MTGRNSEYLLPPILGISSPAIAGAVDQKTENTATAICGEETAVATNAKPSVNLLGTGTESKYRPR